MLDDLLSKHILKELTLTLIIIYIYIFILYYNLK